MGARRTHLLLGGSAGQAWRLWLEWASRSQGLCLSSARQPWGLGGAGAAHASPPAIEAAGRAVQIAGWAGSSARQPGQGTGLRRGSVRGLQRPEVHGRRAQETETQPEAWLRTLGGEPRSFPQHQRVVSRPWACPFKSGQLLPTPWIGSKGPGPLGTVGRASRRSGTDAGQQGRESPLDAQLAWSEGGRGGGHHGERAAAAPSRPRSQGPSGH